MATNALLSRCSNIAHAAQIGKSSLTRAARPHCTRWQTRRVLCRSSSEDGPAEDVSSILKADLERYQAKAAATSTPSSSTPSGNNSSSSQGADGGSGPKEFLDKLLIADFFLVLGSLGWLGAGLAVKGATGSGVLLDGWLPLWQWVWQPAIGVLMAGALVSGGLGWLKENTAGK